MTLDVSGCWWRGRAPWLLAPWLLAGLAVACEMAYPLTGGEVRTKLTIVTVVVFFVATTAAVSRRHGYARTLAYLTVTVAGGLLGEAAGVRTGWPFGRYAYAGSLGWKLLGVPVVVPLAWGMMAYPALAAARAATAWLSGRTGSPPPRAAVVAAVTGWALASWDVFLDPQMVAAGHWSWADPLPALPGTPGIPLTNYAGWLLTAVAMAVLLVRVLPAGSPLHCRADAQPAMLYLWTYASSVLANAALFGRPWVALTGGLVMGAVAVPCALALRQDLFSSRPVPLPR